MAEYKRPYLLLRQRMVKALAAIKAREFSLAQVLLKQAQAEAEAAYISQEE